MNALNSPWNWGIITGYPQNLHNPVKSSTLPGEQHKLQGPSPALAMVEFYALRTKVLWVSSLKSMIPSFLTSKVTMIA